jgi:hypothetical protein
MITVFATREGLVGRTTAAGGSVSETLPHRLRDRQARAGRGIH